jgi:hypothetical protein
MTKGLPKVFVCFFWLDARQEVTYDMVSLDRDAVLSAAEGYIARMEIPEPGYKRFLTTRLAEWDGNSRHVTTLAHGKLVLLACEMEAEGVVPLSARRFN